VHEQAEEEKGLVNVSAKPSLQWLILSVQPSGYGNLVKVDS
jgi:hypothetical protein